MSMSINHITIPTPELPQLPTPELPERPKHEPPQIEAPKPKILGSGPNCEALNSAQNDPNVILNGDSVTITNDTEVSDGTVSGTPSETDAQMKETMDQAVQSLLTGADMAEEMASDLLVLAQQCGQTPPPEGASTPKMQKMSTAEVIEALNAEATTTSEAAQKSAVLSSSSSSSGVMFSIYDLAALLLAIAQEERDSAREMKQAQLSCDVSSIMTQADKQRESGVLGVIVSSVTLVAQAAMMAVSTAKSVSSVKSASNTSAAQDANVMETKAATVQAQSKGPEAAQENLKAVQKQTEGTPAQTKVKDAMDKAGVSEAKTQYEAAKLDESKTKEKLEPVKKENEKTIAEIDEKLKDPNLKGEEVKDDLRMEKKRLAEENDAINETLNGKAKATDSAKGEYSKRLDAAQKSVQGDYDAAKNEAKIAEGDNIKKDGKVTSQETVDAQQKMKDAGNTLKLMDAEVASAKADMGVDKPTEDDVVAAQTAAHNAEGAMAHDAAYMKAQDRPENMIMHELPQMIGTLGQGLSRMTTELVDAEATEEQANQKKAEYAMEEAKDLYSQAGDLVSTARDFLKAVIQAESQSVEQIIKA